MSRLALISVTGAAVVVVAAGLIYSIAQQEDDDSGDDTTSPGATENRTTPTQSGTSSAISGAATSGGNVTETTSTAPSNGTAVVPNDAARGAAASPEAPSFDVVRVNPNGDAVIAGRAKPGADVTLLDDGKAIGSTKADDRGDWVLLPNSSIAPGVHKFTLLAQDDGSAVTQPSERMVIVVVPAPAKDIAGNAVASPAGALAISVPQNGVGPSEILNMPSSARSADTPSGPVREPTLDVVDYDKNGLMALAGRALADSKIALYLDDKLIGSIDVDPKGRWAIVPQEKLSAGRHELRLDQVDADNKVTARIVQPIEQPDFAALTPGDNLIVVQPGNSLWRIARQSYGDGLRFSVIYEANKRRVRDPNLIFPGQVLNLPK